MLDRDFVRKTAELARSAPEAWAGFLVEFKKYSEQRKNDCLRVPIELLQVAQGRAQVAEELRDHLENAVTNADRIEKKA